MSIRVVLADDHPALMLGVKAVLQASPESEVVAEASTPHALIETLSQVECDVLLMDYLMPSEGEQEGRDGLYLLQAVRKAHPALRIVVFTTLYADGIIDSVMAGGASAVLCKRDPIEKLPEMLRLVMSGHRLVRPQSRQQGIVAPSTVVNRDGVRPSLRSLSPRETEVVQLLLAGRTLQEAAAYLKRSSKTISNQKRSAMHKLGLNSDIALAKFAIDCGLC